MNIKKILLVALIAVAIVVSVSAVSAGLFDGLMGGEQQDKIIEIDDITFNTTNVTKFNTYNESEEAGVRATWYMDENQTGYNVHIINASGLDDDTYYQLIDIYKDDYNNQPSEVINGVVIYTMSANSGPYVGQPRYVAYVVNNDLKTIVDFGSPDANETAKMASTLKFK